MRRRVRTVHIEGDATGAVIVQGDHSQVFVFQNAEQVFSLTPLEAPAPIPPGAGPALLLAARHEVVPFLGREEARAEASEWLEQDVDRAVRLLVGAGGQGKTRFALQTARDASAAGWQVMVAQRLLEGGRPPDGDGRIDVPTTDQRGVLIVVDYADRWATDTLLTLLILLTGAKTSGPGPVRILLLGRSSAFWTTMSRTLQKNAVGISTRRLPELPDDPEVRWRMFDAARQAFDTHPALPDARTRTASPAPDLAPEGFGLVLAVHMAALAAVLRTRDEAGGVGPGDPVAISRELLVREIEHWDRAQDVRAVSRCAMARAVLVATLTGGIEADAAPALVRRLDLGGDPQTVLDQHGRCYPTLTHGRVLEPLYPDRLGEDFTAVLLPGAPPDPDDQPPLESLVDPVAPTIVDTLLAARTDPVLTNLVETARRWEHVAELMASRLQQDPDMLVEAGGTAMARAAPIPSLAPVLPHIGDAVEEVIGSGTHMELDSGAVAVREEIVELTRAAGDPVRLTEELTLLATRREAVGRSADALEASEEAVAVGRELIAADRGAHLLLFSVSVTNLATYLSAVGRRTEAVTAAREAVALSHELLDRHGGDLLFALPSRLNNLATFLAEEGLHAEALTTSETAIGILRELVPIDREAHLPELTSALGNLSSHLATAGRWQDALAAADEAVTLNRELARDQPDAHLPNLVTTLGTLAVRLGEAGRFAESRAAVDEAVRQGRDLVARNRDAHLPTLALALNSLGVELSVAGRPAEALDVTEEVRDLYAELIAHDREAHLPEYAMAVGNLAIRRSAVGRHDEALAAARESVELRRELVARNRDAHLLDLAMSLGNAAQVAAELGRPDLAIAESAETVDLFRELVARSRAAHVGELAMALGNLANHLAALGRRDETLDAVEEATTLFREAAARNRDAYRDKLAVSLNNLALRRSENGRDGALDVAREAADLGRDLVGTHREAYLPTYAMTLDTLAARYAEAGRRNQALDAAQKAVRLHRELVEWHREAHLPGLAESMVNLAYHRRARLGRANDEVVRTAEEAVDLCREVIGSQGDGRLVTLAQALGNLATDYSEAGRRSDACPTARDSVAVWRDLAGRYPDAHRPGLAQSLMNLTLRLHEVGQDREARLHAGESERLYVELDRRHPGGFAHPLALIRYLRGSLGP